MIPQEGAGQIGCKMQDVSCCLLQGLQGTQKSGVVHYLIVTRKNNTRKFTRKHFQATLKPVVTITEGICQFIYIYSKKNLQMTSGAFMLGIEFLSATCVKCAHPKMQGGQTVQRVRFPGHISGVQNPNCPQKTTGKHF